MAKKKKAVKKAVKKAKKKAAPRKPKKQAKKAKSAAKLALKKAPKKKTYKIRTSVHFHRPNTLTTPRNPKYPRRSTPKNRSFDKYAIIKHPIASESAMKNIEDNNTLTFIVDLRATKRQIGEAVKSLYQIDIARVRTLVRPDGQKKAYVRLTPDHEALEVANTIGII